MRSLKAIVLAAGNSSRFGKTKQLLFWQNKNMLQHAIDKLLDNELEVQIVLGAFSEKLSKSVSNANIIINPDWQAGIGNSIAFALENLNHRYDAVLILLADQVAINKSDIKQLNDRWKQKPDDIACARYSQDEFGPPAIFPKQYFEQLKQLCGDQGAKRIIQQELLTSKPAINWVDLPNAQFDIDTQSDWKQWCLSTT